MNIYKNITKSKTAGEKLIAVLIDPDKTERFSELLNLISGSPPDIFLVGGSFGGEEKLDECIKEIKRKFTVPVILFPGNGRQISPLADGILLLSVISSRNSELLIGKHVEAAFSLKSSGIEIISTGYILLEGDSLTTVQYMTQSLPIPRNKPELSAATALAGEQLGMKCIYLEAGSGASNKVQSSHIRNTSQHINIPLWIGGGIKTWADVLEIFEAGADVAVIGTLGETDPEGVKEILSHNQLLKQ